MDDDPTELPTPSPEEAKAAVGGTFSAAAATYDQVIDFFGPFGRALVAAADLRPGQQVLDVACGRGACLYPTLEAVGPEGSVLGIDLAEGMVEALRADLDARGVANAEVRQGDAEALDVPDASVDAATGGFMIFFPPDPPAVLRELHRVLRPGGTLALSIFDSAPAFSWIGDVAAEVFGFSDRKADTPFNRAEVLDPALEAAGFSSPDAVEVTERFAFDDVAHVERWLRSHGGRMLFEACDEDQLAQVRTLMGRYLDERHRRDGGGYELVQGARMTVARRR
ncbi:MAG: methyltransferase domain-containing protein [Acidimicrobiales bacterium]|nr:methyltransferase domain-containing protein [Acidimicrobiales bacterium]